MKPNAFSKGPAARWRKCGRRSATVFETLGQPFIDRAPEMTAAFAQLAKDIKPAADELAKITAEGLKGISAWFKENKEEIPEWLNTIKDRLQGVYDLLMLINKIPVLFDLPAFLKKWKIATPQGQLPGSPSKEPSAAHGGGEAGRRYRRGHGERQGSARRAARGNTTAWARRGRKRKSRQGRQRRSVAFPAT